MIDYAYLMLLLCVILATIDAALVYFIAVCAKGAAQLQIENARLIRELDELEERYKSLESLYEGEKAEDN